MAINYIKASRTPCYREISNTELADNISRRTGNPLTASAIDLIVQKGVSRSMLAGYMPPGLILNTGFATD